ncbi:lipocalin family protein [Tropicibacter naphthalenivorans]|uniref:Uncharacterized protein n=1 Tax=Tropicibacter naphthalenivorans TaxID=441103 RepID=A0A0P1G7L3_9RHOB|nr:lipocalin family protein [Tropicibacter naphthalenivorans]CUH77640.1 hypothetical protein TRN7648_01580 [Tropicibacter naphthalenivorans]SMC54781.1 apolipoprotein D and lipocalin family protein [Tropicibacter naphthalenivorans]
MKRAAFAVLLLSACAQPATLPDVAIPMRNPTAPVASQADAGVGRLSGDWVVVQGAGLPQGTRLRFSKTSVQVGEAVLPLSPQGQGRYSFGSEAIWVHWLDADNRTAALGNPDGARVWIMDRSGTPGERLKAAREILDWYGYDLGQLN